MSQIGEFGTPHEQYVYKIKWLGMTVAKTIVNVHSDYELDGRPVHVIEAKGKTNGFASVFYRVKDRFVTFIDKEKLVPLKLYVSRREGTYKKDALTIFDHDKGLAYFQNFLDGSSKEYPIPNNTQDILSLFYRLRTDQVDAEKKHEYRLAFAEDVFTIQGKASDVKKIKLPNGEEQEALLAHPIAYRGDEVVKDGTGSCYISRDEFRAPLFFELKAPLFTSITAVLHDATIYK